MALRLSNGLATFLAGDGGLAKAFNNGRIEIYSGAQPATPEAAVQGTLLCTVSANSGAITNEVRSSGTVSLSGTSGSITAITVNSVNLLGSSTVNFDQTIGQTATDLANAINTARVWPGYYATANTSTGVVTITAPRGAGTAPNGFVVAGTLSGMTATYANMAGGVAPVNGLQLAPSASNAVANLSTQTWSGANAASGTAGWFRWYGSVADTGALDSTNTTIRIDGAVSTSGAELNFANTSFSSGATTTIPSWSISVPGV